MSQARGLLLVFVAWALIYLPGLGSREIKGEEGRRILPAIAMLESGNFIVPQVGSEPYFSKPPLVNWLVAASFKIFGARNEWTARFPSALCVLAVAIAFLTVARPSLGANGSLIAALIWMTNFGMIEKGRLIEIEALYVSLCGLAMICWLSWWQTRRSRWLTWTVPWIFLGLGWLGKGPLHLVFFYAVVLAVLYHSGELRTVANTAHLLGIAIMLAIFAAWAIPCLWMMPQSDLAQLWTRQFTGRLSGEDFKLRGWIMNIPRGLGYFLPWVLLLPFLGIKRRIPQSGTEHSGLIWGIGLSFFAISLLPGALPRYTMPLLVPACWLGAMLLTAKRHLRLPLVVAALTAFAMVVYAVAIIPQLKTREKVRPIAAQINASLPTKAPLHVIDPDYQPFLFYVRDPIVYLDGAAELPAEARYVLVQPEKEKEVTDRASSQGQIAEAILRLTDYRRKEVILLKVDREM